MRPMMMSFAEDTAVLADAINRYREYARISFSHAKQGWEDKADALQRIYEERLIVKADDALDPGEDGTLHADRFFPHGFGR